MAVLALTVGGVAQTPIAKSVRIRETANGRNSLTVDVLSRGGAWRATFGAELILTEDGTRTFGGNVSRPGEAGLGGYGVASIVNAIYADDFNALPRRRYVTGTIPAGTLLAALTWLEPYLTSIGVTVDPGQVAGPALPEWPCSDVRLDDLLTQIARACDGWVWEISYYKVLRVFDPSTAAAPFDITASDGHCLGDIEVETDATEYANRIKVRFSAAARRAGAYLNASANWSPGETVSLGGQVYTFRAALTGPAGEVVIGATVLESLERLAAAIVLAGGSGVTYAASTTANASAEAYMHENGMLVARAIAAGASGNNIAVATTNANATWYTEGGIDVATLVGGADESLTESATADDLTEQGTIGIVERVIQEPTVFDYTVALLLATNWLPLFVAKPKRVRYVTRETGLHPGQVQTITEPLRDLSGDFVITDVEIGNAAGNLLRRAVTAYGGTAIPWRWQDAARSLFAGGGGAAALVGGGLVIGGGGGTAGPVYGNLGGDRRGERTAADWSPIPGFRTFHCLAAGNYTARLERRSTTAGETVTVRIYDLTAAAAVATGAATAAVAEWGDASLLELLPVALVAGHDYIAQMLGSVGTNGLQVGQAEVYKS